MRRSVSKRLVNWSCSTDADLIVFISTSLPRAGPLPCSGTRLADRGKYTVSYAIRMPGLLLHGPDRAVKPLKIFPEKNGRNWGDYTLRDKKRSLTRYSECRHKYLLYNELWRTRESRGNRGSTGGDRASPARSAGPSPFRRTRPASASYGIGLGCDYPVLRVVRAGFPSCASVSSSLNRTLTTECFFGPGRYLIYVVATIVPSGNCSRPG